MSTVTEKFYKYKKSGKICINQKYAALKNNLIKWLFLEGGITEV